ncbi:hypothetical protein R69919_03072 [Paraburkholderia gardini]|uniref:Uncharacterized protein n=1 Tax=Paraburkholderia gardini TaxID=2823469 RepID=A0ABM8U541_9BURK|nr:hypothetical protein R54767_02850 [Paraburkholderia gardini]CAG4903549.1 hypothetical protein R69919_03072 [Paraburkholderia gardini]
MGFNGRPRVPEKQKQSLEAFIAILREFFYINTPGCHREFPGRLDEGNICAGNAGLMLIEVSVRAGRLATPPHVDVTGFVASL